jgi:alpha-tubulin suppressor-like RCC1 family protein
MTTGFLTDSGDGRLVDVDDLLVRRDLFADGRLWAFGYNTEGYLADNTLTSRRSPVTTTGGGTNWKQAAAGGANGGGIKTDGTLWMWGRGNEGKNGDNTSSTRSSPVTTVAGGTNWKQMDIGHSHTAAIKTDGTLWTWGWNLYGGLGDNTSSASSKSSPVTTVGGQGSWKQVSCGYYFTGAIKTDGTLWMWGYDQYGRLGQNSSPTNNTSSPITTAAGGTNWKQVSLGARHAAAIKTDGTLWTWGINSSGQLGDNTLSSRSSPVTTVGGQGTWKQVAAGTVNTAAIKTDGTLWTWGNNNPYGQLGDNTSSTRSSPVTTVAGGTNWKQVAVGRGNTGGQNIAAIKTDGTLWTWGINSSGQLGDNTLVDKSSPVTTVAGGTNWKQVAVGASQFVLAVTDLSLGSL